VSTEDSKWDGGSPQNRYAQKATRETPKHPNLLHKKIHGKLHQQPYKPQRRVLGHRGDDGIGGETRKEDHLCKLWSILLNIRERTKPDRGGSHWLGQIHQRRYGAWGRWRYGPAKRKESSAKLSCEGKKKGAEGTKSERVGCRILGVDSHKRRPHTSRKRGPEVWTGLT